MLYFGNPCMTESVIDLFFGIRSSNRAVSRRCLALWVRRYGNLYDDNGNLKTELVEDIRGVVGGALALIGKAFFRRKES